MNSLWIAAAFDPPSARGSYRRWREVNAELLASLPAESVQVDTGRAASDGTFVRVWLPPDAAARAVLK